jgi:hypothetical protein
MTPGANESRSLTIETSHRNVVGKLPSADPYSRSREYPVIFSEAKAPEATLPDHVGESTVR